MKSVLSTSFLAILSFTSLILAPFATLAAPSQAESSSSSVKKSSPKPAVNGTTHSAATLVPSAPYFAVYSDRWYGSDSPPATSAVTGFNAFILSFLLISGPADQAVAWTTLDAATQASVIESYHDAGIAVMVSAFGSTDAPTSEGVDPVATANTMAAWVKEYGLDGIDVDYEDFNAMNSGTDSAVNWLVSFTTQLRSQLPQGEYIITHAPIAPWLTDDTSLYPAGAYHAVAEQVGDLIDWWNIQFYNQGSDYTTCEEILTESSSDFPHTSIFEIHQYSGIPLSKLLIGKPAVSSDASSGYMSPSTLAGCLQQGKADGWNGGAMFWEYPDATASLISTVRADSWAV